MLELTLKHQKEKYGGNSVDLPAQPLGQHVPGQAMAGLIPVIAAEIVLEAMQKDLMLCGVFLEGRRQEQNRDTFLVAEFCQPSIRVEQALNPKLAGE